MRTLKLITRFYGGVFLANFLVTLCCIYMVWFYGQKAIEIIGILFWFKTGTIAAIFFSSVYYRKQELYYYQNLGVGKMQLGLATSLFDFITWLALTITIFNR